MQRNSASVWLVFSDYTESIAQLSTLTTTKKEEKIRSWEKRASLNLLKRGKKERKKKETKSMFCRTTTITIATKVNSLQEKLKIEKFLPLYLLTMSMIKFFNCVKQVALIQKYIQILSILAPNL